MASPRSEATLLKWFEEIGSDTGSCSDIADCVSEHSVHNTDTEQSSGEEEITEVIPQPPLQHIDFDGDAGKSTGLQRTPRKVPLFIGKDGTHWFKHKPVGPTYKTRRQNIISKLPGVCREARDAKEIIDCWNIFFPMEVLNDIVIFTNQKLDELKESYGRPRDCVSTDLEEMMAFLGLLYLAGVKKSQHLNTSEMWAKDGTSPDYFAATMTQKRFHILVRAIRFDDKISRSERSSVDNLAPIRKVFETFVRKCCNSYTPHQYVTIDEMLEAFRGRCRFRQFIKSKPAKYGLKIYALVDARTFYVHNMEVYCGKQPTGPYQVANDATSVVKRLIKPIDKSGRNVTADNYFSSVKLANDLYANHKLTFVGTLRKNKREIPPQLLEVKNRPVHSTMCAFGTGNNMCTVTSYIPKKHRNVLMVSTFHDSDTIDLESATQKPEVITFYNSTKGGVDVADRMKAEYSVTRFSNRWPFTLFCSLLNIATINSQIVYKHNSGKITSRRSFITSLSKSLVKPHLIRRSSLTSISLSLRQKIRNVAGIQEALVVRAGNNQAKPRCGFCPLRKNRFTNHKCDRCGNPLCKEHTGSTVFLCFQCKDVEITDSE